MQKLVIFLFEDETSRPDVPMSLGTEIVFWVIGIFVFFVLIAGMSSGSKSSFDNDGPKMPK